MPDRPEGGVGWHTIGVHGEIKFLGVVVPTGVPGVPVATLDCFRTPRLLEKRGPGADDGFLVISVFGGVLMILQNFDAGNTNETEGCFLAGSLVPLLVVVVSSCSGVSKI